MTDKQSMTGKNRFTVATAVRRWMMALGCCLVMVVQPGHAADPPAQSESAAYTDTHKVEQGETLWDIAERYLGNPLAWRQLQRSSGVGEPRLLQPGTLIAVPISGAFPITVLHLQGEGWRVAEGGDQPLTEGDTLDEGEVIRTGTGTHLSLAFADGTRVVLPSRTVVTLGDGARPGSPRVILEDGEVEAYVPSASQQKRLEVETSVGVLGVRGTHFRVRTGDEQALTEVLEGRVASARPRSQGPEVAEGYGLVLKPQGPLDTVKLLPAPAAAEQRRHIGAEPSWQVRTTPIDGAASYHAEVSLSSDFLSIKQAQSAAQPAFDFPGLDAAFYHVRIAAVDGQGLRGMPATFILANHGFDPSVQVQEVNGGMEFRWSKPRDWRYGFQIAQDEDFRQPFADKRNLTGEGVKIARLPSGRYYWRLFLDSAQQGKNQPLEVVNSGVVER